MPCKYLIIWLILSVYWSDIGTAETNQAESPKAKDNTKTNYSPSDFLSIKHDGLFNTCSIDDFACLTMAANDKLGLDAIKSLHKKLDDDENGNVDLSESDDFLRGELKYSSNYERRQKAFHRNDDQHISVKELWEAWLRSEVHNWTVEETTEWLSSNVGLPQYVSSFIVHKVTGANLPRLAVNNANYLNVLGIKDPIHRQKIALKAMDVVLFGPPKDYSPIWKDRILIILLVIIGISGTYAYRQHKKFKSHLNRMNRDMDSLQNAEKALENLQKELEFAKQQQESVISEKENLEKKLQNSKTDLDTLPNSYSDLEITQLKAEIEMLRTELQIAKSEVQDRCWSPPAGLQQWLQLTHEIENKAYLKKKMSAEKQLQQAREACEKLRKKRTSLVGAFVSTHGKSIDDVDRSIVEARTSLNEVTQELQERVYRWKQIEMLFGFNIINNSGLQFLENQLYRNSANGRLFSFKGRMSSQDSLLEDDNSSVYGSHLGGLEQELRSPTWREGDSSGSEEPSRQDEEVQFIVGAEASEDTPKRPNPRSISNNNIVAKSVTTAAAMTRSYSQDTNIGCNTELRPKSSQSDTSLSDNKKLKSLRPTTIKEQMSNVEEDVCSTDSSLLEEDIKKKRRKLFNFSSKKSKANKAN